MLLSIQYYQKYPIELSLWLRNKVKPFTSDLIGWRNGVKLARKFEFLIEFFDKMTYKYYKSV